MAEREADVAGVVDPDVVLLEMRLRRRGSTEHQGEPPRWALTSSLWRVGWFPFVLDNLPSEIQPANHKPPAGVDEAGVRRFLGRHAELDTGGPVGFVMWSQRQFREASSAAATAAAAAAVGEGEAASTVAATPAFNRNGLRVSLFSEPMPPFLYGRGPQGWQDASTEYGSQQHMVHVVDGTGAATAIRIDPQYDAEKEAERARGGAEGSVRWMALPRDFRVA
ncbi:hypothetical protein CLOP_g2344 [Closterium sp. NIES-67]|nr:hypothetical protein CLOP_g2344 [Closterium sp. NIES-67]